MKEVIEENTLVLFISGSMTLPNIVGIPGNDTECKCDECGPTDVGPHHFFSFVQTGSLHLIVKTVLNSGCCATVSE